MPKKVITLPSTDDTGVHRAVEYLNFLVVEEYMPPEIAQFYVEMSLLNKSPIHYFLTEALVEYFMGLSQEPDEEEAESIH